MVLYKQQPIASAMASATQTIPQQTWIELDSKAFDHNILFYKDKIGHQNILAIVIKGNGYGHGTTQMAMLCQENDLVDWICMVNLSEAVKLTHFTKPILILGYSDISPVHAIGKNIHFLVDQLEYAQMLNQIGQMHDVIFNIHVKIDTGLSRMGLLAQDALAFIKKIQPLTSLKISGLCSHFSASDSNKSFTDLQFEQFNRVLEDLQDNGISPTYIHLSNSASISTLTYPQQFNLFRIGAGAYGIGYDKNELKQIMTWKTKIVNIKTVPAGSYISYANSYQTERTTKIALLPIGYYDGYDLRLSNKSAVIINKRYAPVLGRIAMNMTIIDVTDIDAHIGDEVTIIGNDNKVTIHALTEIAEMPNPRELLTGISPNINRTIY